MSLYATQLRAIEKEAESTLVKLAEGRFSDITQAKGYVEYRKGLLRALEILRHPEKSNDNTGDL